MKKLPILLGSVGLAVSLGFLSSNAQDAPQPKPPAAAPEQGMMGNMPMTGMMGMMERMNRMMDQCERMMQGREKQPAPTDRPPG
jgi:hypothetical protein